MRSLTLKHSLGHALPLPVCYMWTPALFHKELRSILGFISIAEAHRNQT